MKLLSGRHTAMFSAGLLLLIGTGCATKKHVRQVVAPVEARVSETEKRNTEQQAALGELENSVSRADEHAMEADKKAAAAGENARKAGEAAQVAHNRANDAYGRADSATALAESTRSRMNEIAANIDNFELVTTEKVLFRPNRYQLTKEMREQLDAAVASLKGSGNFVLEIQGYADSTGSKTHNLELSQKRADSVVRYLTVQHNIPLRKINVLGIGEEDPNADNKTREGRKEARRVELRVYALNLGQDASAAQSKPVATTKP